MIKVYVNAFELKVTDAAMSIDQFCTSLARDQFHEITHSSRQRVLGFGKRDGYLCGILLSTREQRRFITIKMKDGRPVASVRRTRQGELMADVNYFAINAANGSGVLTAYYGSGGMCSFGNILAKMYRTEVEKARDIELEECGEIEDEIESDVETALIKRKYQRARLELTPMLTDSKFAADLKRFAKYARFEYVEPTLRDNRYKPIGPQITKQRRVLYLTMEGASKTKMREFISGFVDDFGVREGTVFGNLESGEGYSLPITPDVCCLSKYPHDDVVTPDNIRLDRVARMPIFDTLLNDVNSRKELFA